MINASQYYDEIRKQPLLKSGDPTLDALLDGGFFPGPVFMIYGPKYYLSQILMRVAVNSLQPNVDGGINAHHVAYLDGINNYDPYLISKLAVARRLNPTTILKQILVSRTFTWNQMVEVVEEKIPNLENIDLILISGLTTMFEETSRSITDSSSRVFNLNGNAFQDLNRIFGGLKAQIAQSNPIIILTGPLHSKSLYRPAGGQLMSHFCGVMIGIKEELRYIDYHLDQHPFLAPRIERYWKSLIPSKNRIYHQNSTLDSFLKKQYNSHKEEMNDIYKRR